MHWSGRTAETFEVGRFEKRSRQKKAVAVLCNSELHKSKVLHNCEEIYVQRDRLLSLSDFCCTSAQDRSVSV